MLFGTALSPAFIISDMIVVASVIRFLSSDCAATMAVAKNIERRAIGILFIIIVLVTLQNLGKRCFQVPKCKTKAKLFRTSWHHALSGQQHLRHFTEDESQREVRRVKDRRPRQSPCECSRQAGVGHLRRRCDV